MGIIPPTDSCLQRGNKNHQAVCVEGAVNDLKKGIEDLIGDAGEKMGQGKLQAKFQDRWLMISAALSAASLHHCEDSKFTQPYQRDWQF